MTVTSESGSRAAPSRPRPLVSVALCTYEGATWLPELLASLVAQDLPPDELVVQDDASTDDTVAVLQAFGETAPIGADGAVTIRGQRAVLSVAPGQEGSPEPSYTVRGVPGVRALYPIC